MDEENHTTQVTQTETIEQKSPDTTNDPEHSFNVAERVVWFITGILLTILGIRFLLSILGANTTNPFADFIYSVSKPFVRPFFSLFKYDGYVYGESRFEMYTLVAILVYLAIAFGITKLISITRK